MNIVVLTNGYFLSYTVLKQYDEKNIVQYVLSEYDRFIEDKVPR